MQKNCWEAGKMRHRILIKCYTKNVLYLGELWMSLLLLKFMCDGGTLSHRSWMYQLLFLLKAETSHKLSLYRCVFSLYIFWNMFYKKQFLFCWLFLQCWIQITKTIKEKSCFPAVGKKVREAWRRTFFKDSERKWG